MRTLAIGDIHGGLKALIQILENAKITKNDQLIFLGDYVDRGYYSVETVSLLLSLKVRYPNRITLTRYTYLNLEEIMRLEELLKFMVFMTNV